MVIKHAEIIPGMLLFGLKITKLEPYVNIRVQCCVFTDMKLHFHANMSVYCLFFNTFTHFIHTPDRFSCLDHHTKWLSFTIQATLCPGVMAHVGVGIFRDCVVQSNSNSGRYNLIT